jgi:protein phosphatase 1 regulatory subunit 12A
MNSIISDEVNRQSNAIDKRREQLRRWDQSETNKESSNIKYSQRVQFCQSYIFLSSCLSEDKDEIEYLLKNGIDINTSNIYGLTALHQASIDNNLNMVKYLINQNANINYQDNEGWTPLHAAVYSGNIQIVKYLLNIGAIVDICNNEGQLPIDITEDKDIISILENDIKTKGIDYQQSKNYEHQLMIKHAQHLLYFNKNDFKLTPDSIVHITTGAKALHVAAAKGYLDVIE